MTSPRAPQLAPMTRTQIVMVAAGGSALLLLGAWMFQMIGYAPCKMCIWQRWPHAVAFVIGVCFFALPHRATALLGALAAATTAAIGLFHAGVEQKWWEGPSDCTGSGIGNLSGEALLSLDTADTVVMCDEIAWQLAGLSMAGWNAVISLFLMALWIVAARRS